MNQFVASPLCPSETSGEGRGASSPIGATANLFGGLSPYEYYVAETQRRYRTLTDAGIEDDTAIECATWAAMQKVAAMLNADNYEFSPNVYGSEQ